MELHEEQALGTNFQRFILCPISLQWTHAGGIQRLETPTFLTSNRTLTFSCKGFQRSIRVRTFATFKLVLFAVKGWRNFGSLTWIPILFNPSSVKNCGGTFRSSSQIGAAVNSGFSGQVLVSIRL